LQPKKVAHVVVVGEAPAHGSLLTAYLISAGHEVSSARDDGEMRERLRESPPALVLLDGTAPDGDGFRICERIKGDSATRHVPVVLVTSDSVEHRVRGRESGADELLVAPPTRMELLLRVELARRAGELEHARQRIERLDGER